MPTPTRYGYTFDGWFTSAEGGEQVTAGTVCNGDMTLYAHWTRIVLLQGDCGDDLHFTLWGDGVLEVTGSGRMTSHPWTEQYAERVAVATLPETLTRFCESAFENCKYLHQINLPTTVTELADWMFYRCSRLQAVTLPNALSNIGCAAFYESGLSEIAIPNTVLTIGDYAFIDTNLAELELPNGLKHIGQAILAGNLGVKQLSIPASVEDMQNTLLNSGVETIVFQQGTTQIHVQACEGASALTSVTIPDTVTEIRNRAFYECTGLKEITLPNSVIYIGCETFAETGLTSLTLPKYLSELGFNMLKGNTGVKSIIIPKTLTTVWGDTDHGIAYGVFTDSGVETAVFEAGIKKVDKYLFANCTSLKTVTLPDTVVSIEDYAFCGSGLTSIGISTALKTIGSRAFQDCASLKAISLPDGLTSIGYCAFSDSGLTDIQIPISVTSIGEYSFANTSIIDFSIGPSVTDIGDSVCYGCKQLKTLVWDSDHNIPQYMFAACSALHDVTIGGGVTRIERNAFEGCTALKQITIPVDVTAVEQEVFMDCTSLTSVILPVGLKSIGNSAFSNCDALTALTIPNSVTDIGEYLCSECDRLETVALSTGLSAIPKGAFYHCVSLNNVVIPYKVAAVGEKAFGNCVKLRSVMIPRAVTSIDGNSFNYPDKLTIYGMIGTYAQTYADEHFFTFAEKQVQATDVQLIKSGIYIVAGFTATAQATILPLDFTDEVTWRSDDPSVATVDNKGVITAQGQGVTEVYVEIGDVSASCSVTVLPYRPFNTLSITEPYPGIIASGNLHMRIWCNDERLLQEPEFTSDPDATVVYQGLSPGYYRIKLENAGFVSNEKEFVLSEDTTVDVPLTRKGNLNGTSDSLGAETSADDMQCLFTYLSTGCREGALKEDEAYFKKIADINEDGAINILDYQALYEIVKHTA